MNRSAICFLIDQVSPNVFFRLIDDGIAPNVVKYILGDKLDGERYSNATISRNIVTGFPSTSANSHTTLLTGSFAGRTDLLDTCFWVLDGRKPKFRDTEAISLSLLKKMNEQYINPDCKMMFEYAESSASFHALNRGANFKLLTQKSLITKFLPLLLKLKKKVSDPASPSPFGTPEFWKTIFKDNLSIFLKKAKNEGKLPEITFIVFLLTDENGHKFGYESRQYREALSVLDFFVKCLVEGFHDKKKKRIPGLKELGLLDSVVWCMCTDHAARKVNRDKFVMINSLIEWDLNLRLLEGRETKYNIDTLINLGNRLDQINAFTHVDGELFLCWFGNANGDGVKGFSRFHSEDFFRKIQTKRTGKNSIVSTVDLVEYLIQKEFTQFVIIPEPDKSTGNKYNIKIISRDGKGLVKRDVRDGEIHYSYSILDGSDPLDYYTAQESDASCSHLEWLEKTYDKELPDMFHRLYGFFDCRYAPNLVVTSEFKYQFCSVYDVVKKKENVLESVQSHGGLYAIESVVPLTLAGPGVKKGGVI
ncbi:MAG: alkaline phosphatase family protein, partial [Promethearchaeota archaeon]